MGQMSNDTTGSGKGVSRRDLLRFSAGATVATSLPPAIVRMPPSTALPAREETAAAFTIPSVRDAQQIVSQAKKILDMAREQEWLADAARALGVETLSEKQKELLRIVDTESLTPEHFINAKHHLETLGQSLSALEHASPDQLHASFDTAEAALSNTNWFVNTCSRIIGDLARKRQHPPAEILQEWRALLKNPEAITLLTSDRVGPPLCPSRNALKEGSIDAVRTMLDTLSENPEAYTQEIARSTSRLFPFAQQIMQTDPGPCVNSVSRFLASRSPGSYEDGFPTEWEALRRRVEKLRHEESLREPRIEAPQKHAQASQKDSDAIPCVIEEDKEKNALAEREGEKDRHYTITAAPKHRLSAMQFRNLLATHVPEAGALGRMAKTKIETIAYTKEKDGQPELFQHALRISTSDDEVKKHLDHCCTNGMITLPTLRQSIDCTPTPRVRG